MVCLVYLVYLVSLVNLVQPNKQDRPDRPNRQKVFRRLLVRGARWFWSEPGSVLEDAFRAGIVDELLAADETLLHRYPTPGAKTIREVGYGRSLVRC